MNGETFLYGDGGTIAFSSSATNAFTIDICPVWDEMYIHQATTIAATTASTTAVTYTMAPDYNYEQVQRMKQAAWGAWNVRYTTGAVTCATTSGDWYIDTATTATNAITTAAWTVWNDRFEALNEAAAQVQQIQRYSRRKLSEEELLAELEREKRIRMEAEERVRKANLAKQRAEELLHACLSEQQLEDLVKRNCFYIEIDGTNGKKERYRIDRGSHGNVKQLDAKGSIIRSFCIQPPGVPDGDAMLAQKLFLEGSEEARAKFWETANITEVMREKAVPHTVPRSQRRKYAQEHGLLH